MGDTPKAPATPVLETADAKIEARLNAAYETLYTYRHSDGPGPRQDIENLFRDNPELLTHTVTLEGGRKVHVYGMALEQKNNSWLAEYIMKKFEDDPALKPLIPAVLASRGHHSAPLGYYAQRHDWDKVKTALEAGAPLHGVDSRGSNLLHILLTTEKKVPDDVWELVRKREKTEIAPLLSQLGHRKSHESFPSLADLLITPYQMTYNPDMLKYFISCDEGRGAKIEGRRMPHLEGVSAEITSTPYLSSANEIYISASTSKEKRGILMLYAENNILSSRDLTNQEAFDYLLAGINAGTIPEAMLPAVDKIHQHMKKLDGGLAHTGTYAEEAAYAIIKDNRYAIPKNATLLKLFEDIGKQKELESKNPERCYKLFCYFTRALSKDEKQFEPLTKQLYAHLTKIDTQTGTLAEECYAAYSRPAHYSATEYYQQYKALTAKWVKAMQAQPAIEMKNPERLLEMYNHLLQDGIDVSVESLDVGRKCHAQLKALKAPGRDGTFEQYRFRTAVAAVDHPGRVDAKMKVLRELMEKMAKDGIDVGQMITKDGTLTKLLHSNYGTDEFSATINLLVKEGKADPSPILFALCRDRNSCNPLHEVKRSEPFIKLVTENGGKVTRDANGRLPMDYAMDLVTAPHQFAIGPGMYPNGLGLAHLLLKNNLAFDGAGETRGADLSRWIKQMEDYVDSDIKRLNSDSLAECKECLKMLKAYAEGDAKGKPVLIEPNLEPAKPKPKFKIPFFPLSSAAPDGDGAPAHGLPVALQGKKLTQVG